MTSVLDQARAEGYRKGYQAAEEKATQLTQLDYEGTFYEGQQDAWADAPSRLRWWLFGLLCGALFTYLTQGMLT